MDTGTVICPTCGTRYKVAQTYAGRRAKCRQCKAAFQIAAIVTEASVPPAAAPTFNVETVQNEAPTRHFHTKLAGVTHRNRDGRYRQDVVQHCQIGEQLALVREPNNRFDRNAVAVHRQNGEQLGYLNAELACDVAQWLDQQQRVEVQVSALTGGGFGKSFGVNIYICMYGHVLPPDGDDLTVQQEIDIALATEDIPRVHRALKRRCASLVDRHFHFNEIIGFAYKKRKENPQMSQLCEQAARLHMAEFPKLAKSLKKNFGGIPPLVPTFQQLALLLTEQGRHDEAIEVCEKAIAFGLSDGTKGDYQGRIKSIMKKRDR